MHRYVEHPVRVAICILSCLAFVSACKKGQKASDETLEKQILSNDKAPLRLPPPEIASTRLHEDKRSRALVLTPLASDLEKRLPQFQVRVKITLDAPGGARSEEHVWKRAKSGHFSVKHAGSGELTEWIVVRPTAYVKHNKGEWRKRPFTIEHSETLKRDVVMQLSEPMALFFDGMTLTASTPTSDNGRDALRYKVSFQKNDTKTGEAASRATMNAEVRPVDLSGEIVVDKATGVLLTADLKASFDLVPGNIVKMKLAWALDSIAAADEQKLEPTPPTDAVVERGFDRPPPDVLGFWGNVKKSGEAEQEEED
jgi:hypothetical protein